MRIKSYQELIIEGVISNFDKNVNVKFRIDGDNHFYDRLSRGDNEPDFSGSTLIDEIEVVNDIKSALPEIVRKTLFNNGIYWDNIKRNNLNSDILIKNVNSKLNTLISISKEKFTYIITVKTVMRKNNFKISQKEKTIEVILR
jgi:hypothetical protein